MLLNTEISELTALLRDRLSAGENIEASLDQILKLTGSRATGLWLRYPEHLELIGFRGVAEMPDAVQHGFADATRHVPLSQTGLGIVKAVIADGPAIATLAPENTGLGDSASWLARFEARSSIAVPIRHADEIVGVLAISTAEVLTRESPAARRLAEIAAAIGAEVASWQRDTTE